MKYTTTLRASTALAALLAFTACSEEQNKEAPAQSAAPTYTLEKFVEGSDFHGIHGITFTKDNRLLAGSVLGGTIYEVDVENKTTSVFIGPDKGMADDLEEGPNGELGWTSFLTGDYWLRTPEGKDIKLATGLPGINSTAWKQDGRLFASQVFLGDALYELDPTGATPPRKIMEGMGGLNGFDFGPDGKLYGPLWFKGQIVRVDVDAGTLEVIAEGFTIPAAVNFDSKGQLWAVDTAEGAVYKVNIETGERTLIADVEPAIDNMAFDKDDRLFISNMSRNAIIEINTDTGEATEIVGGPLAVAADIDIGEENGREVVYIGDVFSARKAYTDTGEVAEIGRVFGSNVDYPINVGAAHGKLAMAGWSAGAVQLIDLADQKNLPHPHHGFTTPTDALPLPNGDLLVTNLVEGTLISVNAEGTKTILVSGLVTPGNMDYAPDGTLYVTEYALGRISKVDLATSTITPVIEGLTGPEGFDITADGTFYVAQVPLQKITAIAADGTRTDIGTNLPIGLIAPEGGLPIHVPTGVVVTKSGDVIFSSDLEAALYRLKKSN